MLSSASLAVLLDGTEVRSYYTTDSRPGPFDSQREMLYLAAGRHELELRGPSAALLARNLSLRQDFKGDVVAADAAERETAGPRVWLWRLVPGADDERAWTLTQSLPAESVFRRGEEVKWIFRRSTVSGPAEFRVKVSPLRDGGATETWSGSVRLKGGEACAEGAVEFPRDLCGAFEYRVFDGTGRMIEGPWEFLVMDPTPEPVPKESAAYDPVAAYEALPSGGRCVDTVDFAQEGMGTAHLIRDNGTSFVVTNGTLVYRQTTGYNKWGGYHNIGAKDGSKPIPVHGILKEKPKGYAKGLAFLDWFGCTLDVRRPGVAHLAVIYLPEDRARRICVQLIDPTTAYVNGALYEIRAAARPGWVKMVVPFWPTTAKIDVLTYPTPEHHGTEGTPSAIGKIELYEFPDGFPALPEAAMGWNPRRTAYYSGEQGDLGPERATTPKPWEDDWQMPQACTLAGNGWHHYDYKAFATAWQRFGEYSRWNGDIGLVWPLQSYDISHMRMERLPWGGTLFIGGRGFTDNDRYSRNTLKIIALSCEKYGVGLVGDFQVSAKAEGLAGVVQDVEGCTDAELEGLVLTDGRQVPTQQLNPAHPVARRFLVGFYEDAARACRGLGCVKGFNVRNLGFTSSVSAWFKDWTVGYDAYTVGQFSRETGAEVRGGTRDECYAAIISDPELRRRWFLWRVGKTVSLRREMLAAVRRQLPDAVLTAMGADAVFEGGGGLDAALLKGERDLGFGLEEASSWVYGIEMNGMDPVSLDTFDVRPGVKRIEPLEKLSYRNMYPGGICTSSGVFGAPYGTSGFATGLARRPLDRLSRGAYWCLPPGEESIRRFIQAWRAIPDGDYARLSSADATSHAVWATETCTYLVNLKPETRHFALDGTAVRDRVSGAALDPSAIAVPPFGLRVLATAAKPSACRALDEAGAPVKAADPRDWAVADASRRLVVRMTNPGGHRLERVLGVLSLRELVAAGGRVDSIRAFKGGCELPLQIDFADDPAAAEVAFLAPFAEGEAEADVHVYLDGAAAVRRPDPFVFATNATATAAQYAQALRNGEVTVGFSGTGIGLLRRGTNDVFRGLCRGGGGRPVPQNLVPFSWDTRGYSPLRLVSSGPVRAILAIDANSTTNVETLLNVKGGGNWNAVYLQGGRARRTYQMLAGDDTLAITDRYTWDSNPGRIFRRWCGGYNRSFCGPADEGGAAAKGLAFRDSAKGILERRWNGKSFPDASRSGTKWIEISDVPRGTAWDLAVDGANTGCMGVGDALFVRFEKRVGAGAGSFDMRLWLRVPPRPSSADADKWYNCVTGLQPVCETRRLEWK